jgi:hypothetical protein
VILEKLLLFPEYESDVYALSAIENWSCDLNVSLCPKEGIELLRLMFVIFVKIIEESGVLLSIFIIILSIFWEGAVLALNSKMGFVKDIRMTRKNKI